jgi:hypothetical protein
LLIKGVLREIKKILKIGLFGVTRKKNSTIAAQIDSLSRKSMLASLTFNSLTESVLNPKLVDFYSHLHITFDIREFHNKNNSDLYIFVN